MPIATGPYVVDKFQMPRRLELKRRADYWAKDLPVRRGFWNFDRIIYRMYKDQDVRREGFKGGEFDMYKEYRAGQWVRSHRGPKWESGRIAKQTFKVSTGSLPQAMQLNTAPAEVPGHPRARGHCPRLRLRQVQPLRHLRPVRQPVQQHRLRGPGPAHAGRAGAAGTLPRRPAGHGVRPALPRAALWRQPERPARQPAPCTGAAGRGRLEARPRRLAAQRRRREADAGDAGAAADRPPARLRPQPEEAGHRVQRAPGRLRAVPPAHQRLRLRHGHHRRAQVHPARRRPAGQPVRQHRPPRKAGRTTAACRARWSTC